MQGDPKGYYARLEVEPWAPREAITAAYRRKARVLHPDIPVTGNAAAFVAMKEAYEVLTDPLRRAAYDRAAKAPPVSPPPPPQPPPSYEYDEAEELYPEPPPPMRTPKVRQPRLSDMPTWLWIGLLGVCIVGVGEAALQLNAGPAPVPAPVITPNAPFVPPAAPPVPIQPVQLAGSPNAYVLPSGGDAVVWRHDPATDGFVPLGHLPPFTAVQVVRTLPQHGMVEVLLSRQQAGFIDASRLTPGNSAAAHRAFCAYNAGPEPANAEVLARSGSGSLSITLVNRSGEPAVVKLRTTDGVTAASVYLSPMGSAQVSGLPAAAYQPEYAVGELWSRTCNSFAAGMQAERFSGAVDLSRLSSLVIPPDLLPGVHPVDIPNKTFQNP